MATPPIDTSRLEGVFSSLQESSATQVSLLQQLVNMNIADRNAAARSSRFASISSAMGSAAAGAGAGVGSAAQGIGGGLGSILSGMGGAARGMGVGLAIAAVAMSVLDADKIKDSVETLLSIGEDYESRLEFFADGGGLALALFGLGFGLKQLGIGASATVLAQWISGVAGVEDWAEKVKDNVLTLLSIADITSASQLAQLLFSGGVVPVALYGLGTGLIAFGAGQALTGLGQWVTDTDWAVQVKDNVLTLLSIADGPLENIGMLVEGAMFPLAMTGLGIGLGVFAVGQAATGLAQFITSDGWAQEVKDNVLTLLSISESLGGAKAFIGESAIFLGAMTGIGLGLAAFGIGAIIAGGGDMLADWFAPGEGRGDWAQVVYDNVAKLLSISEIPGIGWDTAEFVAVMGGISAGLLAFGVAGAGVSALDALADWMGEGEGRQDWTQKVYDNVANIISILDILGDDPVGKATLLNTSLGTISRGLDRFGASQFISGLTNAADSILSFFTGGSSAFDQIMRVADESERLTTGANAVERLTIALEKLGNLQFDGRDLNLEDMAKDLANAVPVIETAIMGGTFDDSWLPFTGKTIQGLANPSINYDDAVRNITNLNAALSGVLVPGQNGGAPTSNLETILAATAAAAAEAAASAALAAEAAAAAAARAGGTNIQNNNTSINTDSRSGLDRYVIGVQ